MDKYSHFHQEDPILYLNSPRLCHKSSLELPDIQEPPVSPVTVLGALHLYGYHNLYFIDVAKISKKYFMDKCGSVSSPADCAGEYSMLQNHIREIGPRLILINYMATIEESKTHDLINRIALDFPETVFLAGGVHATLCPEWVLNNEAIDFLLAGEVEKTIGEFLSLYPDRDGFQAIPGLYSRGSHPLRRAELVQDIALYPYSISEVLFRDGIPQYWDVVDENDVPSGFVFQSRGCPSNCRYCANTALSGNLVRHLGSEESYRRFLMQYELGVRSFYFSSDNTGIAKDIPFFIKLAELHRDRPDFVLHNLNAFRVGLFFKGTNIDFEFISLLKNIGFRKLYLAIETFDTSYDGYQTKKQRNSSILLEDIISLGITLRELGIQVAVYMMYGFPAQTKDSILYDIECAKRLRKKASIFEIHFFNMMLFPGSKYYRELILGNSLEQAYRLAIQLDVLNFRSPPTDERFNFTTIPLAALHELSRQIDEEFKS